MEPETKYTRSGGVNIAYQVDGDGPLDLVVVPSFVTHVELQWDEPSHARFLKRLASFSRVILFDKRGTGLSDRVADAHLPTLEERMDDMRAVMDAVGSDRAALFGFSEGGPMSALFGATYPQRASALILYGSYARFPHIEVTTAAARQAIIQAIEDNWGVVSNMALFAPSMINDEDYKRRSARFGRMAASPRAAALLAQMNMEIDIRHVLPAIRIPTLILQRSDELVAPAACGRYLAQNIPGARYVELPGMDHLPWVGDQDAILDEVEEFLTGVRHGPEPDRVLATVMFTDIVGSTEKAAAVGDAEWRGVLEAHNQAAEKEIARWRGREVKSTGDGVLATFDGPGRAIRCAQSIAGSVEQLGVQVRAGLHTGECELMGADIGGIAVHIASRVAALAGAGEVLVSSTVKDLVAGSGIQFEERGSRALKGVPDEWRIFAVRS
jgi:pimeloyl-ACP methyl ester carboxylesterase